MGGGKILRNNTSWIRFGGVRNEAVGVEVISLPPVVVPGRYGDTERVYGRGDVWVDGGDNMSVERECVLRTLPGTDKLSVLKWLSGYGLLVTSDMPNVGQYARVVDDAAFERFAGCKDTLEITFVCSPYWVEAEPESVNLTSSGHVFTAPTWADRGVPMFTINGTSADAVITIAGISVDVGSLSDHPNGITIDCDARIAVDAGTNEAVPISLIDGEWPTLPSGNSAVSWSDAGITSVLFYPGWRWG